MSTTDVVNALDAKGCNPRRNGEGYSARCPAHDDHNPSLSLRDGDKGGTVLTCHAGCDLAGILAALDLPMDVVRPPRDNDSGETWSPHCNESPVVDVYPYVDAGGQLLFEVLRHADKHFMQRRPDPCTKSGWKWKSSDTRPLYRLPRILKAVDAGDTIYVVEGEKDVHSLERIGLSGTCNPMGAGKWRPEHTTTLAKAHVVVIADRDDEGRQHARAVADSLEGVAASLKRVEPVEGKDLTDHLAAGFGIDDLIVAEPAVEPEFNGQSGGASDFDPDQLAPYESGSPSGMRHVELVPASSIEIKPVHWLWKDRIPLGELTLLAGREGIGKSIIAYTLAAWITRGTMKGRYFGEPRSVVVAATEDSWEHTIVPRLMAAGADLDRVFRIDVVTEDGVDGLLTLPSDIAGLHEAVRRSDAALVLLDPLISRLSAQLDSHKDAEVRVALEPLTAFAKRAGVAVLGIIHVNKSNSSDALNVIMGSRAFGAVARAVLMAVKNPEQGTYLFGLAKNNLGSKDQPAFKYRIVGEMVAETDEGPVWTGKIDWLGKSDRSVDEVMIAIGEGEVGMDGMSATDEAAGWLEDYLNSVGGSKASSIIKTAGAKAGHKEHNLKRAAAKLKVRYESEGFPRTTIWTLPVELQRAVGEDVLLETQITVPTVPTTSHTHTSYTPSPPSTGPRSGNSRDSGLTLQETEPTAEPTGGAGE